MKRSMFIMALLFLPLLSNAGKPPNHGLPMTHVPYHYSTIFFELAVLVGLASEVVRRSAWYYQFKTMRGEPSQRSLSSRIERERQDEFSTGSNAPEPIYNGVGA